MTPNQTTPASTQFDYLLNAFEQASQSDKPAENDYAAKRKAVLDYVRKLEALSAHSLKEQSGNEKERKDAERYRWLCEKGYHYHGAIVGTGSMSIGRGPYIILEPPAHNSFSKMVLGKVAADEFIDAAMQEGKQS